jgi:hypothetical protein
MGNIQGTMEFPCQKCGDYYKRKMYESLSCINCRKANLFEQKFSNEKQNFIDSHLSFPPYCLIQNKTNHIFYTNFDPKFYKPIWKSMNKKNYLIKEILKHLDQEQYLKKNNFLGIFIRTKILKDSILIIAPNIEPSQKVVEIDIDGLNKKLFLFIPR